jgi:hypothetical protein
VIQPQPSSAARADASAPPGSLPPVYQSSVSPPSVYDPQSGNYVPSGLIEPTPGPPSNGRPANIEAEGLATPEELARKAGSLSDEFTPLEYGSSDFDWEPTYSEAIEDEESSEDPVALSQVPADRAWMYETPEWERPQVDPPRIDTGRHTGWSAGFTIPDHDEAPPAGTPRRKGWRSIPRAE